MEPLDDPLPTIPIHCYACHGAVTVHYEPGESRENEWHCPHCGNVNELPMQGQVERIDVRRLPN